MVQNGVIVAFVRSVSGVGTEYYAVLAMELYDELAQYLEPAGR